MGFIFKLEIYLFFYGFVGLFIMHFVWFFFVVCVQVDWLEICTMLPLKENAIRLTWIECNFKWNEWVCSFGWIDTVGLYNFLVYICTKPKKVK